MIEENGLNEKFGYESIEKYDPERLAKLQEHYQAILELLGEDPNREGLLKTPLRVAKSIRSILKIEQQSIKLYLGKS